MSWTTMPGQKTTTSVHGRDTDWTGMPIKLPEMIASLPSVAYVARGSVQSAKEIRKLRKYVKNAIEAQLNNEGYSLVEVMAPCPTNWGMPIDKALAWMDQEVSSYYTLGELRERKGD